MLERSERRGHRLKSQAITLLGRFLLKFVMRPGTVVWYPPVNGGDGQGVITFRNFDDLSIRVTDTGNHLPHWVDIGNDPFSLLQPPRPSFLERMRIGFFR